MTIKEQLLRYFIAGIRERDMAALGYNENTVANTYSQYRKQTDDKGNPLHIEGSNPSLVDYEKELKEFRPLPKNIHKLNKGAELKIGSNEYVVQDITIAVKVRRVSDGTLHTVNFEDVKDKFNNLKF